MNGNGEEVTVKLNLRAESMGLGEKVGEAALVRANLKAQAIFDANNTVMTPKQCAAFMACTPRTVLDKIKKGEIAATFKTGHWRIPKIQFLNEIIQRFSEEAAQGV